MRFTAIGHLEPARGSALLLHHLALGAAAFAMLMLYTTAARCAGAANAFPPEVDCTQIRESVHKVAQVERDEALALHLMPDGRVTPMVQTRLTQLQARIGELREALRQARRQAAPHDSNLSDCIEMGSQSLADAEKLSSQIQEIVMDEGGPLGPPQIKSGGSRDGQRLLEPPLPDGPIHEE
jgi:hypothetical protein